MSLSIKEFILGFILLSFGYLGLLHLLGIKTTMFLFLTFTGLTFMIESDIRRVREEMKTK